MIKNLLIVRTDRIGDVVLSLPLAPVIKKSYPDCKITFLVREYTKPLVTANPFIDEIITLKMSGPEILVMDNVKVLRQKNFDAALMVYPTFRLSLIIFLSGIKLRIGTGYRWYSFLFNRKVYEHRKYAEKHELEYNFALLSKLGINNQPGSAKPEFGLTLNEDVRRKVLSGFVNNDIDVKKKLIIVHPGSGGSAVNLPLKKFRELIEIILSGTGCEILVTGSTEEKPMCEYLVINDRVKNLAGLYNLDQLIELIRLSSLFISNSTGPLHIAAALDKYVIGFYPKVRVCSAKRWGPYSEKGFVFEPEMDCRDCTVEQCIKLDCMSSIDINKVFENIEKILKLLPNTGDNNA